MSVAGLILAAGESRRMGSPKALLRYRTETFLDTLTALFAQRCAPVIVVLGAHADQIRAAVTRPATFVVNPDHALGMTTSLQCGLRAVPPDADGVLFTLVDHPAASPATLDALLAPLDITPLDRTPVDKAPVNRAPVENAAVNMAPLDKALLDKAPVNNAPMASVLMGSAPMGGAPKDNAPVGNAPLGSVPMGSVPMDSAPMGKAPMGKAPMGSAPMIRVPRYRAKRGHPIWFSRELVPEFLALPFDGPARDVVARHVDRTEYLDLDDPGIVADIDSPEDYRVLMGARV